MKHYTDILKIFALSTAASLAVPSSSWALRGPQAGQTAIVNQVAAGLEAGRPEPRMTRRQFS